MHRRRPLAGIVVLCLVVVAASVLAAPVPVAAGPVGASTQAPAPKMAPPTADLERPLRPLAEALSSVAVSSSAYAAATARRDAVDRSRQDASRVKEEAAMALGTLRRRGLILSSRIRQAHDQARRAKTTIARIQSDLRALAVANYIGTGSAEGGASSLLASGGTNELGSRRVLVDTINAEQLRDLRRHRSTLGAATSAADRATTERDRVRRTALDTAAEHRDAVVDERRFSVELMEVQLQVEADRRLSTVEGADFPLVVLDAYVEAARLAALEAPTCGLRWWALAGIGHIESGHGTFGGAEVRPDGGLNQPIIGVPLTGVGDLATIGDTDGGLIDGDRIFDRAAGPMQFIPSTWVRWARDGNGDGRREIQNVYDATAAAAAYLCAGGPMDTDAGLQQGYFSYNHSLPYVATVLERARRYAAAVPID